MSGDQILAGINPGGLWHFDGASWQQQMPYSITGGGVGYYERTWSACDIDGPNRIAVHSGTHWIETCIGGVDWTDVSPAGTYPSRNWKACAISGLKMAATYDVAQGIFYNDSTEAIDHWQGDQVWALQSFETYPAPYAWWTGLAMAKSGATIALAYNGTVWYWDGVPWTGWPSNEGTVAGNQWFGALAPPWWVELAPAGPPTASSTWNPARVDNQIDAGCRRLWVACDIEDIVPGVVSGGVRIVVATGGQSSAGKLYYFDGVAWTEQNPAGSDQRWTAVSLCDGRILATAYGGRVYYFDGSAWAETRPAGDTNQNWIGCALSSTSAVAIVAGGRLYRAPSAPLSPSASRSRSLSPSPSVSPSVAPEALGAHPLLWIEWNPASGSMATAAEVRLADPSGYYGGMKAPRLLRVSEVRRALSGPHGDYETGRFEVTLADNDRAIRGLLGNAPTSYWLGRTLFVRMLDDASRRLMRTPRLVAFGLVDRPVFSGNTVTLQANDAIGAQRWVDLEGEI